VKYLKKDGFGVKHATTLEDKQLKEAGIILLGNKESISAEKLSKATKLKVIGYLGNSKKHIPQDVCTDMGIVIFDNIKKPESVAKRMAKFINSGDAFKSSNFPNIQLPKVKNGHRFIHIHRNVPGIMARVNQVLADGKINIVSQFLMTNERIGYVITDISAEYDKKVLKDLKHIKDTISFRVLY
ncbi:MAG TPA: phosphoserine phosphatase, partial [Chitinophaga sp.]